MASSRGYEIRIRFAPLFLVLPQLHDETLPRHRCYRRGMFLTTNVGLRYSTKGMSRFVRCIYS